MKKFLIINLALIVLFSLTNVAYTQIIYSDNDYGCGWENYAHIITRTNSWEIGVNLLEYASGGVATVNMAQIIHSGDWNPDPSALPNLSTQYNSRTGNTMTYSNINLATADLSNVDLLYITGHYSSFSLSPAQKAALKGYLDDGGVLFADDCSNYLDNQGFETSFRNLINELYGSSLAVLPSDHAVYSSFYALDGSDFSFTYPGNGTEWNQEPLEGLTILVTVEVDVKPGSFPSSVNLKSKGLTPVAIHTTDTFDATEVDPLSVMLDFCAIPVEWELYDCDELPNPLYGDPLFPDEPEMIGDDDIDLVLYFETRDLVCLGDVTEVTLTGTAFGRVDIIGTSDISLVKQGKP